MSTGCYLAVQWFFSSLKRKLAKKLHSNNLHEKNIMRVTKSSIQIARISWCHKWSVTVFWKSSIKYLACISKYGKLSALIITWPRSDILLSQTKGMKNNNSFRNGLWIHQILLVAKYERQLLLKRVTILLWTLCIYESVYGVSNMQT